jgi:hypothetical protein
MDKTLHTVTVPRDYLEELEKFKEENRTDYNAKISLKNIGRGFETKYATFLEVDKELPTEISDSIIVIDKEGRELAQFLHRRHF